MTLRQKTLLIIGLTLVGLMAAMYLTSKIILVTGLREAEEHAVCENVRRLQAAYAEGLEELNTPAGDWSKWDDTCAFVEGRDPDYVRVNCTDESLATLKLNLLLILDKSGRTAFGTGFDLQTEARTPVPAALGERLAPGGLLLQPDASRPGLCGLILLPEGPLVVAARPILDSQGEGPSRGTLIFGRYLGSGLLEKLRRITRLSLAVTPLQGGLLPRGFETLGAAASEPPILVRPVSEQSVAGYTVLRDVSGQPCLLLRAEMPRAIYTHGRRGVRYAALTLLAAGLLFGLVVIFFVETGVLSRLARLSGSLARIGESGDLSGRVAIEGSDELSSLAGCINGMLASFEGSQQRLKSSEERFRSVAETATDAIISADSRAQIVFWNRAAEGIFGYPPGEVLGRPLTIILPEHLRAECELGRHRFLAQGEGGRLIGQRAELTGLRRGGEEFAIEMSLATWSTEEGVFFTATVRDIAERKRAEERLKYLSLHDPLTGLYNRTYFEQEMHRFEGDRYRPVSIIMSDVDGLKLVNDTLGHDAGDTLLVAAAAVVRDIFRKGDMVARIGGDEFAVLLPNCAEATVRRLAGRIGEAVAAYNGANPELPLSVSIGFATGADPAQSLGEVFKEADNAMYREKLHRSQSARSSIVQTLMKAMEARDFITEGHADRLQELAAGLARSIGLPEGRLADMRLLAQFHDIGKVGIPDRILFKPGPLDPEERSEMRRHCEIGYRIAQAAPELTPIADRVLKHHESWDGSGYPLGLKGEEIPLECRILAIADAYDVMTSERPYRQAMPRGEALAELERCAGTQFDPGLVPVFIRHLEEAEALGASVAAALPAPEAAPVRVTGALGA